MSEKDFDNYLEYLFYGFEGEHPHIIIDWGEPKGTEIL